MQMPLSNARQFFEQMWCSHFHMSRDYPSKYEQYLALGISKEQECNWRRERIDAMAKELSDATSAEWQSFTQFDSVCEYQGDIQSLQLLNRIAGVVRDKLPPKGGLIVAELLIGISAYHYNCGAVYFAVALDQKAIARQLVECAEVLIERAKTRRVAPPRVQKNIERCIAVRNHFKL